MYFLTFFLSSIFGTKFDLNLESSNFSGLNKITRTRKNNYRTFEYLILCPRNVYLDQVHLPEKIELSDENLHKENKKNIDNEIANNNDENYAENNLQDKKQDEKKFFTFKNFIIGFFILIATLMMIFYIISNIRKYGIKLLLMFLWLLLIWPFIQIYKCLKLCFEGERIDIYFYAGEILEIL